MCCLLKVKLAVKTTKAIGLVYDYRSDRKLEVLITKIHFPLSKFMRHTKITVGKGFKQNIYWVRCGHINESISYWRYTYHIHTQQ